MHRRCSYRDGSCGRPDNVRGMGGGTGSENYIVFQGLHSEPVQDCEAAALNCTGAGRASEKPGRLNTDGFGLRTLEHGIARSRGCLPQNLERWSESPTILHTIWSGTQSRSHRRSTAEERS